MLAEIDAVADLACDGLTMRGQGEMSKDGGAWEPDLALAYTKLRGRGAGEGLPSPAVS